MGMTVPAATEAGRGVMEVRQGRGSLSMAPPGAHLGRGRLGAFTYFSSAEIFCCETSYLARGDITRT